MENVETIVKQLVQQYEQNLRTQIASNPNAFNLQNLKKMLARLRRNKLRSARNKI